MLSRIPIKLEEIAIAAKEYAQKYIRKSYTQLENNNLPEINQLALYTSILDIRDEINGVIDFDSLSYEKEIEIIKKYSLGNCREMARLALYYVLIHHPNIFAQICYIEDGDHVFLIVGEDETKAFICDPWSNEIYYFSEWRDKLKNYTSREIALSEEALELQENRLKDLEKQGLHVERKNFPEPVSIYNQKNEYQGKTYFFNTGRVRSVIPLREEQFIIPSDEENSDALYNKGATFRRSRIKAVLELTQSFHDILYPQIHILKQLLSKQHLLQDDCLQSVISNDEWISRKKLIMTALIELKRLKVYLKLMKDNHQLLTMHSYFLAKDKEIAKLVKRAILFEKFYPIPEQLEKINHAIDCLNQLLEGHSACYIDTIREVEEPISEEFRISSYKLILEFFIVVKSYQDNPIKMQEIQEVGQLINDLKSIIFDFVESPTLIKSKALSLTFCDVKETLESFNNSPEHLLILPLNKLIELFSNVEKMRLPSKKINDFSNNLDASKNNNIHALFSKKAKKDHLVLEDKPTLKSSDTGILDYGPKLCL